MFLALSSSRPPGSPTAASAAVSGPVRSTRSCLTSPRPRCAQDGGSARQSSPPEPESTCPGGTRQALACGPASLAFACRSSASPFRQDLVAWRLILSSYAAEIRPPARSDAPIRFTAVPASSAPRYPNISNGVFSSLIKQVRSLAPSRPAVGPPTRSISGRMRTLLTRSSSLATTLRYTCIVSLLPADIDEVLVAGGCESSRQPAQELQGLCVPLPGSLPRLSSVSLCRRYCVRPLTVAMFSQR